MPLVSVAMATYNGEKYIREQLDSILSQTFQDFELIVCDDCSADSTVQLLNEYEKKDSRIKVFVNEKNFGFKKNFEKAISLCSGKYIALSDQDDIWKENHIEKLLKIICGHDIACGNPEFIDSAGKKIGYSLRDSKNFDFVPAGDNLLYRILLNSNPFQGASMLIRRSFLASALPIPESVLYHDTWFSTCSVFLKGLVYTEDIITFQRLHGNNASGFYDSGWNFFKSLKRFFSGNKTDKNTDRFVIIDEIEKRFSVTENQKKVLGICSRYEKIKTGKSFIFSKLKFLPVWFKIYKDIYSQKTFKHIFVRTVRFIFA